MIRHCKTRSQNNIFIRHWLIIVIIYIISPIYSTELRWDWNVVSVTDIFFPRSFFWGVSDSALQCEGNVSARGPITNDNWLVFEKTINIPLEDRVGEACQRWTRYPEDIARIKNLGMNIYRFSILWSKIEPEEGVFDYAALAHYQDMIDELLENGITPMVNLFHHTYPSWIDEKGGLEKFANLFYFLRFADFLFKHLHTKVRYWITFNEPTGFAMEAYFRGVYPPGKRSLKKAGLVTRNLLFSHVEIVHHLKKIDPAAQFGIAQIFNPIDPYSDWNILEKVVAKLFNGILTNSTITFFRTGHFNWRYIVSDYLPEAVGSLDFIGINYYTHTIIHQDSLFHMGPGLRPEETVTTKAVTFTDTQEFYPSKALYAEGLYRAILDVASLKIPCFITENGSNACCDIKTQDEYIKRHLFVVSKALKEGHNIMGYLYWTLTDCFCWRRGYRNKHGIFEVDFKTQERIFRPVFNYLIDTIKKSRGL